ncbi:MAG: dTMP kinase, partial [Nitrososphaerales archaeon]
SPSNLIYGISRGFDRDWLVNLESGLPDPDVVIVMDIDPASSTQRKNRQRDLNERDDELLTRVCKSYREMSEEKGGHLIDGEGAIDRIHEDIWRVIKSFFDRVGPESR